MPKSNDIHFAQAPAAAARPAELESVEQQEQQEGATSRTMLTTDSKALVLALPSGQGSAFNGYEPGE